MQRAACAAPGEPSAGLPRGWQGAAGRGGGNTARLCAESVGSKRDEACQIYSNSGFGIVLALGWPFASSFLRHMFSAALFLFLRWNVEVWQWICEECKSLAERGQLKQFAKSIDESLKACHLCFGLVRQGRASPSICTWVLSRDRLARKPWRLRKKHASALNAVPLCCMARGSRARSQNNFDAQVCDFRYAEVEDCSRPIKLFRAPATAL